MLSRQQTGKTVPFLVIEHPSFGLGRETPPLLEKEGDVTCKTLVADFTNPLDLDRPRTRTAFASDDDPVDSFQVQTSNWTNQRFNGKEPDGCIRLLKVTQSRQPLTVFDGDPEPNMWWGLTTNVSGVDVGP